MRRDAGMTAFEAVVLAFIILAVVFFLLPVHFHCDGSRSRAKHSASQAVVQDFSVALKAYETDFGDYPPDEPGYYITRGHKGSLADLLSKPGRKNVPYYYFRDEDFDEKGRWLTRLRTPYKYRKNAGRTAVPPDPSTMMNVHSFDMWACGVGDEPRCDPETSEPAREATIKNW